MLGEKFNTPEENRLIAAAARGDDEAFGRLVTMYEKLVYNTVRLKVPNQEDALDLSQEIFVKLWRSIDKYRGDCKFSTWLYKICSNAALDFLRQSSHSAPETLPMYFDDDGEEKPIEIPDETSAVSPEQTLEKNETVKLVHIAIEKLNSEQREIILLRDIQGYSYEEIADMLQIEIGTVKSRLSRARSNLREMLLELSPDLAR